jgi:type I restriction enzyme S subunit
MKNSRSIESENYPGSVLPKKWLGVKLGEICATTSGGTPNRGNLRYFEGEIPWLKSGELKNGLITSAEERINEEGLQHSSAKIIPKGTLLVALYGATVGKLGVLAIDAAINQAICAIFTPDYLDPSYLFWFLTTYRKNLLQARKGGAQPNISQRIIKDVTIPLAPRAEQQRIVAKIEELLSRLDAGIASLRKASVKIKQYRHLALSDAFHGKLTQAWREINEETVEPPRFLVERIKENDISEHGTVSEISQRRVSKLTNLPQQWLVIVLKEVCDCLDNLRVPVKLAERNLRHGEIPYYGASGQAGWINNYLFDEPLLLIAEDGQNLYSRKLPIAYSIEGKSWVNNHAHVLRIKRTNQRFVEYYINSIDISPFLTGTTRPKLNKSSLLDIPVPLPSVQEQNQIVDAIDRRFFASHLADVNISEAIKEAEILRQSILRQAFEGKLLPQNPRDEPADRLLAAMRAKRGEKIDNDHSKKKNMQQMQLGNYAE